MNRKKRVLIAYDGSECANNALEDLKRAGLPDETEVFVVTIADVFPPPEGDMDAGFAEETVFPAVKKGWAYSAELVKQSQKTAEKAAQKIQKEFPGWKVRAEGFADSPSWGVIKKAQEWKADLIVVGAHGMHSTARLALGSLSQLVATQAPCSVRVVHGKPEESVSPPRIVVGVDGSFPAYQAVNEIASRNWKKGTAIHIITVEDGRMKTAMLSPEGVLREPAGKASEKELARKPIDQAIHTLNARDLNLTSLHKEGDPKNVLLEEAERWGADCIFVGARGLSGIAYPFIGSVSSALAARSHCTVEIVRSQPEAGLKKEKEGTGTALQLKRPD